MASGRKTALTAQSLATRVAKARAPGAGPAVTDRARRLLGAWLATAGQHGRSGPALVAALAGGAAARDIGAALRDALMADPPESVTRAACAPGCAFCCILSGGDGGLITEDEARTLHAALLPLAREPDGRRWHPDACPALDPESRTCRAYDARPTICRSFLSTDADACRANAEGGEEQGAGVIGPHLDYLAVLGLTRAALKGIARVPTYALARVAAGAVAGEEIADTLAAARHATATLDTALRDAARRG